MFQSLLQFLSIFRNLVRAIKNVILCKHIIRIIVLLNLAAYFASHAPQILPKYPVRSEVKHTWVPTNFSVACLRTVLLEFSLTLALIGSIYRQGQGLHLVLIVTDCVCAIRDFSSYLNNNKKKDSM